MSPLQGFTTLTEKNNISDVVRGELSNAHNREIVDIATGTVFDLGDIFELSGSDAIKVATAANAAGVFLEAEEGALVDAFVDLEFTANPADGDTVTVSGRAYKFETGTLAAADDINVGADANESINALISAINGGVGGGAPGISYRDGSPVENADVSAEPLAGDIMRIRAKVSGTVGNAITIAESSTAIVIVGGGTTLAGGQAAVASKGVFITLGPAILMKTGLNYNGVSEANVDVTLASLGFRVVA